LFHAWLTFSPWRWRQFFLPKRLSLSRLQGLTAQKTVLCLNISHSLFLPAAALYLNRSSSCSLLCTCIYINTLVTLSSA
jgi:hypothetical protein